MDYGQHQLAENPKKTEKDHLIILTTNVKKVVQATKKKKKSKCNGNKYFPNGTIDNMVKVKFHKGTS